MVEKVKKEAQEQAVMKKRSHYASTSMIGDCVYRTITSDGRDVAVRIKGALPDGRPSQTKLSSDDIEALKTIPAFTRRVESGAIILTNEMLDADELRAAFDPDAARLLRKGDDRDSPMMATEKTGKSDD